MTLCSLPATRMYIPRIRPLESSRGIVASRELPLPRGTAVARTSIEEDVLLPFFPVRFQNPGPSLNFQNYVSSSSREHPTVGYLFFPFSFFFFDGVPGGPLWSCYAPRLLPQLLRFNQRTSFITREYLDLRNQTIPLSCLPGEPAFYLFREEVSRKRAHLPHLPVIADIRSRKEWHKSGPETRQG